MVSRGSEISKIYLTSLKDDSVSGDTNNDGTASAPNLTDWNGVAFWDGSAGDISHAFVRYTGGFNGTARAGIYNLGGNLKLDYVEFSNNFENDIYHSAGSATITHSQFSTSTAYAIFNVGTDVVDAIGNWWGSNEGPTLPTQPTGSNPRVTENVLYEPWIKRDPALPNPVIIVPGIAATYLIKNNNSNLELWLNLPQMLTSITDSYLDDLSLLFTGEQTNDIVITTNGIIRETNDNNFFNGLFSKLNESGLAENDDLFEFPYDWRLDISQTANDIESEAILSLKEKIDEIKDQTGAENIDIVAHSMGGLLVKRYLKDYGGDSVSKFIDIGTPHTGAPKAFKILNYGDNFDASILFGLLGLNSQKVKEISQNMPAVYQLLPSQKYFEDTDSNYYVFNGINGNNRLTFSQTGDYLKAEGRNAVLVDRADEFHQEIDGLNPADYGVETYNFVGCGTPTIGQFYLLEGGDHPIYNIKMINGDGTVPLKSAEAIQATQTYYVKNAKHAVMPSTSGVKELVTSILTGEDFDISSYSNLATNSNDCQIPNGQIVSLHSPIELHIYDSSGNHTGPDENGDIENEISGVVYEVIDDNKFAFLPNGADYIIKGTATDTGTFDVRIQEVTDGEVSKTTLFTDIPLTSETHVQFDIGADILDRIYLDTDNDGNFESNYSVSTTTDGILESTGKTAQEIIETIPEPVVEPVVRGSSGPTLAIASKPQTDIVEKAVPVKEEPVVASILSVQTLQAETAPSQEKIQESVTQNQYENSAIVYKSFSYKIVNFFKKIWFWIISKL